jgi:periplasmic copper chaperone A
MSLRTLARLCALPAAVGVVVVGAAAPAGAHVTITPTTTAAGAYTVLTVSVPHGCDGSATTRVSIQMPDEINAVTPTRNPLWEVEKEMEELDPPVTDAHGNEITERVATVTYTTDTPLPDGYRDSFELSLQLPDAEGTTLVFPAVQTCEEGESAWIQVPEAGESAEELELPAPTVTVTAAGDGPAPDEPAPDEPASASSDSEDSDTMGAWGLGAGVLGALLGGAALVQGRRRP